LDSFLKNCSISSTAFFLHVSTRACIFFLGGTPFWRDGKERLLLVIEPCEDFKGARRGELPLGGLYGSGATLGSNEPDIPSAVIPIASWTRELTAA
jgi:hypothetical protein